MNKQRHLLSGLGLTAALGASLALSGCQGSGAFAQLNEKLAQLTDNQAQILSRIDGLETKVVEAAKAAPARPQPGAKGPQPNKPVPTATYKATLGDAHAKGSDEALVTVIAWSDFQCPYCSRVVPTMAQIEKEYGDDVRIAFKHNPLGFHPRAKPAALAAEAAGRQGKFWEMHDKLFENQKQLTDENFLAWAGELGLDIDKFKTDLTDAALAKKITTHQAQGMTLGARGTPAFFVNGRFLSGAQPFAKFKTLIDQEKAKAEKLVAAGTPRAKVYEKTIAKGKTKV